MARHFLEPTFAELDDRTRAERRADRASGCCSAPSLGWPGIALAYRIWVAATRASPREPASASPSLHRLFVNKWYFDELIDLLVVRPCALVRPLRPADLRARLRQRRCSSAARPASCAPARRPCAPLQTGFLRALRRAARPRPGRRRPLLPAAVMTIHLSILLWLPLALGTLGLLLGAARGARPRAAGVAGTLVYAIAPASRTSTAARRAAVRHRRDVDRRARASTTSSASTG